MPSIEEIFDSLPEKNKVFDSDGYPVEDWGSLEPHIKSKVKTGSRVIYPSGASNSDYDWIVLVTDIRPVLDSAFEEDWVLEGNEQEAHSEWYGFCSLRRNNVNLIITSSQDFYNNFDLATKVAKELELSSRDKRVCLFQAILYDEFKTLEWAHRSHYNGD